MAKKTKATGRSGATPGGVNLAEVELLLEFMEQHGLEEFEYERNGVRVRLKKPSVAIAGPFRSLASPEIFVAGPPAAREASPGTAAPREGAGEAARSEDLHIVKSPIVGTFYAAATPGGDPFVTIGANVEAGQVLCIIEAMKLMNEIEADVAGEVAKVFVENGQPVEYGEPLFGIRPQRKK